MGRGYTFLPKKGLTAAQAEALITGGDTEIDAHIQAVADARIAAVQALPGWVTGLYYGVGSHIATSMSASALSANFIYAMPVIVPDAVPIDRIGAEITTISAGKSFRTAIYLPDGTRKRPGTLLVDSGNLSAGVTGFIAATIANDLPRGLVWFCIQAEDGTMQFRVIGSTVHVPLIGKTAGGGTGTFGSIAVAQAFGAFPATFPGGASPNGAQPVVDVRAA